MDEAHAAPKIGIALSGGGARGAYQVGVLKAVAKIWDRPESPFRIVTGISVGAINAMALVCHAGSFADAVAEMERLWRGLHCASVFRTDLAAVTGRIGAFAGAITLGRFGIKPPESLFDNSPLRDLLDRELDVNVLRQALADGRLDGVGITASSYLTGQCVTFCQTGGVTPHWARSRREGQSAELSVDHVLASTALPFVFPAQRIGHAWFGDGALRQTSPLSPAIHMGARRLFVIAGRDGTIDEEPAGGAVQEYPQIGVIGGQLLDIVFNDHLDSDIERLGRVNATLARMTAEQRAASGLDHIGVLTVRPSEDVRDITARFVGELPRTVRLLLKALGAWRAPFVLPSYLMFEPGYAGALIDLGERDATAQTGAIRAFLGMPAAALPGPGCGEPASL